MSDPLSIYNAVRAVPLNAQKPIAAGRLKGKTDINPMWRIKTLTERFGPCGIGWWYTIERQWLETGANGEIAAFCDILLYYRDGETVSQGIPGTGGSAFVAREKGGLYTSDECYKMALTDALSVACKSLGIGADVYWSQDSTKYEQSTPAGYQPSDPPPGADEPPIICVSCHRAIPGIKGRTPRQVADYTMSQAGAAMCWPCFGRWKEGAG